MNTLLRRRLPRTTIRAKSAVCTQYVEHAARELLSRHSHFAGRAEMFCFAHCDDVLTVRGHVPTFYLKQLLQNALQAIDGVRRIDNQVDVVSSRGLSSIRTP